MLGFVHFEPLHWALWYDFVWDLLVNLSLNSLLSLSIFPDCSVLIICDLHYIVQLGLQGIGW